MNDISPQNQPELFNKPKRRLRVRQVLCQAWKLLRGSKSALWGVNITTLCVLVLISFIFGIAISPLIDKAIMATGHAVVPKFGLHLVLFNLVFGVIFAFLCAPFIAGTLMVAIKRARGETVGAGSGYAYMNKMDFARL